MGKSIITIEEESTQDENGKLLLKRKITVNARNTESVIYEDSIKAKQLHKENTPLNEFYKWTVELFDDLHFNEKET